MEYRVIRKEFGGQPLAGYMMNVIDLTRDKDGLDAMAFLKKVERYAEAIEKESYTDDHKLKEFFFGISTEEDVFAMDFYVGYTVAELKNKDYTDGWEYDYPKCYRMYVEDEEWGLDEIQLCDGDEVNVAEINIAKEVTIEDVDGINEIFCPTCGYAFLPNERCPECGQLVKVKEESNMEISYVLKEKLSCGCWAGCFEYFFQGLCTEPTERLRILTAINEFMYEGDEYTVKKFICLDTELYNVDSLDDVRLMNDVIDSMNYKKAYVAMLDENGNPSLYEIELREVTPKLSMFERILKTVEAKLEVDGYVLENDEIKDLKEQIEWLKEQIRKENN